MFEAVKPPPKGHAFCVVCLHPERTAIERDFINAQGKYGAVTAIMRKYGIKHSASLYEHARATDLDAKRREAQAEGLKRSGMRA